MCCKQDFLEVSNSRLFETGTMKSRLKEYDTYNCGTRTKEIDCYFVLCMFLGKFSKSVYILMPSIKTKDNFICSKLYKLFDILAVLLIKTQFFNDIYNNIYNNTYNNTYNN